MDTAAHLRIIRAEGDVLGATAPADLGRPVPTCPEWDVAGLIGHTSWVHRYATAVLDAGPGAKVDPRTLPTAPEGDAVLHWYRDGLASMLDTMSRVDLGGSYRTFIGPQPGSWWARRMAHETTVHRWDAQAAIGAPDPIRPEVAVDGVDEALDTYVIRRFDHERFGSTGQTVHLHATDTDGEWFLTMDPAGVTWERGHRKGDVALRGPASALQLWVMSRLPTEDLDVVGDAGIARSWQDAARF